MNRYFAGHAVVARLVDTGFEVVNPSVLTLFPFTITSLGCGSGPRLGRNYGRFPRRRGNSTLFVLVIFLWSIVDTHTHNCFLFIVFNLVTTGRCTALFLWVGGNNGGKRKKVRKKEKKKGRKGKKK